MKKKETVHLNMTGQKKRFFCGMPILQVCDPEEDWEHFNRVRTTTWKEVTCVDCTEQLYQLKKLELNQIGKKLGPLWELK